MKRSFVKDIDDKDYKRLRAEIFDDARDHVELFLTDHDGKVEHRRDVTLDDVRATLKRFGITGSHRALFEEYVDANNSVLIGLKMDPRIW